MANRDLFVIGGSTGSHAVLRQALGELPADFPVALLVVTHMPADHGSILPEALGRACQLPVVGAEDGMTVEAGRVHVAAPDHHLILVDGTLRLGRGPRENMARPSIDPLFRSAALVAGPRSVGVILTGMLNDGASGLRALRDCGGVAVVQDPGDAVADEMPCAAIEAAGADYIVPASGLGALFIDLAGQAVGTGAGTPSDRLRLEVEIALGERSDSRVIGELGAPAALTCPACSGVLSEMQDRQPLRYRCQVGHGYTAEALDKVQEEQVDEALRISLRVIAERAELVRRMARDARETGRHAVAELYEARAVEYAGYAETIRQAVMMRLPPLDPPSDREGR